MPRERALLCDLDGVLRRWPAEPVAQAEAAAGVAPGTLLKVAFAPERLEPAIRGQVSDAEWRAGITRALSQLCSPVQAALAVVAWSASPGELVPEVWALLERARERCALVLVTNATTRLETDLLSLGLSESFDAVVSSARIGVEKPRPEFYAAALEAAGVAAEAALFVDDTPANVVGAEAAGIESHRFREVAELARWLSERGVVEENVG